MDPDNPSSIYIKQSSHSLSTDLTKQPSFFDGANKPSAYLLDVNGNSCHNSCLNSFTAQTERMIMYQLTINNKLLPQKCPLFIEVLTVEERRIHLSIEFL